MKKVWLSLNDKYQTLSQREKVLTLASGVVLVFFVGLFNILEPMWLATGKLEKSISAQTIEQNSLLAVSSQYRKHLSTDPNISLQQKIVALRAKLEKAQKQLVKGSAKLVQANTMAKVVNDILSQMKGITVLKFDSLEPEALLPIVETDVQANVFRHGISLKLMGNYTDLYQFLAKTEQLPWQLRWKDFNFKVNQHPEAELTIAIYALSLEKEFIGL